MRMRLTTGFVVSSFAGLVSQGLSIFTGVVIAMLAALERIERIDFPP